MCWGGGGGGKLGHLTDIHNEFKKNLLVKRVFATSFQNYIVVDFVTEHEQCSSKGKTWIRRS
jgi:hypothetical protein